MKQVLALCGVTALAAAVGGCACSGPCRGQTRARTPVYYETVAQVPAYCDEAECPELVGPRGPDGPSGPAGERGPTGQTGPPGYAQAGPRGETGPRGYAGEQGPTGAAGPSGALVRGRVGAQGAPGDAGEQGPRGHAGVRGESAAGYAGPVGERGMVGPAGSTGSTGPRGAALEGPTGPAGRSGSAGMQGTTGYTGAQGSTTPGVAGPTGASGAQGPQGSVGAVGAQGRVGVLDCWTSYRDVWFQDNSAEIQGSEHAKLAEVATYMKANPSLEIGIDGSLNARGTNAGDRDLSDRRVKAIRDSLVQAGVSPANVKVGAFGDPALRRDGRVEVLIATGK